VLHCSKDDLRDDFEDSAEITGAGLYRVLEAPDPGQLRVSYGLLVGDYEFTESHQDIALLRGVTAVAARTQTPFLAHASSRMFGVDSWEQRPDFRRLAETFEGPRYDRWRAFREREDARYVGLCAPRFLLRAPYATQAVSEGGFAFEEDAQGQHDRYVWGGAALALATRVADSFAKYRWCPNILGRRDGAVAGLPTHTFVSADGEPRQLSLEASLSEREEFGLSELGFIGWTSRAGSGEACFFAANSCQKPRSFDMSRAGREAENNARFDAQLPYLFILTRLAHYLHAIHDERRGAWNDRAELERALYQWLAPYSSFGMEALPNSPMARIHPLRKVEVKVEDGAPWGLGYRYELKVQPQFKDMGVSFTLSLNGRFDSPR
jgi:type VI secretion system protein ImpC